MARADGYQRRLEEDLGADEAAAPHWPLPARRSNRLPERPLGWTWEVAA